MLRQGLPPQQTRWHLENGNKEVTEGAMVTQKEETASLQRGRNQTSVHGDRLLCKDGLVMVPGL